VDSSQFPEVGMARLSMEDFGNEGESDDRPRSPNKRTRTVAEM